MRVETIERSFAVVDVVYTECKFDSITAIYCLRNLSLLFCVYWRGHVVAFVGLLAKVGCRSVAHHLNHYWNSLPNFVVDVDTVCLFKTRLDKFWMHQDVMYDFAAELTGIGDRSVREIS